MAMTAAELEAKKNILLMDVSQFLAYAPDKSEFHKRVHTSTINCLRKDLTGYHVEGYLPVVLILTNMNRAGTRLANGYTISFWGDTTKALTGQKLQEHGLEFGQLSDQEIVNFLDQRNGSTHSAYEAALDKYIAHLKSLEAGQNPVQPTSATNPDETVIKMSPRGLTMTFGDNVDPARIEALQKAIAALTAQHLGPSGDADNTAPAPLV